MKLYCVERYVQVPLSLIRSNLSAEALSISVHLLAETAGHQRTQVDVSKEAVGRRVGLSWRPTQRAFDELQQHGLIALSRGVRSVGGFCTRVRLDGALGAAYAWSDAPPARRESSPQDASPSADPSPRNDDVHLAESQGCTPAIPRGSSKEMKNIQETSSSKPVSRQADVVVSPEQSGPFSVLRGWGVPVKRALSDLLSYPLEAVQKAIRVAQTTPNAKNPPALYTVALREGWELPTATRKADEQERKLADFQTRLSSSVSEPREEQPALKSPPSPLDGITQTTKDSLRLEARRRVARLLGRTLERVRDDHPLVDAVMVEIAEERKLLIAS